MNTTGYTTYLIAKKSILSGNMLFSKRPDLWLPKYWPTYFTRSKDVFLWDLKKKKLTDMLFAVGQNTLGYCNDEVDREVLKCIKKGNLTSLNCPEEIILSKKLIQLHPWADLVKFARSGGEANAIAVRIARCASINENIAVCGYHGWHDWYLAANIKKKNLDQHLIKGLEPSGVPKKLRDTIFTFNYGDIETLEKLVLTKNIGIIKMEVARGSLPNVEFLKRVRSLCNKKKIILIFDECTSGFRRTLGGLHLTTAVEPDIAMFGKALGNGYAITAVIGKKNIMLKAKESFISSTFWTERIGFVAGISTLEVMKYSKSWLKLIQNGKYINSIWRKLAKKYSLKIKISGIESITSFDFEQNINNYYKTYLAQEMLKKNYLSSNLIYLSVLHNKKIIDKYSLVLDKIFKDLSELKYPQEIKKKLRGPICGISFSRLNN